MILNLGLRLLVLGLGPRTGAHGEDGQGAKDPRRKSKDHFFKMTNEKCQMTDDQ